MVLFPGTGQPLIIIPNTLTHTMSYSTKHRAALMFIIPTYAQTSSVKLILVKFYTTCLCVCWYKAAVPLQAWSVPEGYRKLRFPDFMTTAQDGGKFVSLTHRPSLPTGNTPGTHFCWRLSRPQGHNATGRIVTEKVQ
jgi:hypothetical protein